jgi:hypothetical protein
LFTRIECSIKYAKIAIITDDISADKYSFRRVTAVGAAPIIFSNIQQFIAPYKSALIIPRATAGKFGANTVGLIAKYGKQMVGKIITITITTTALNFAILSNPPTTTATEIINDKTQIYTLVISVIPAVIAVKSVKYNAQKKMFFIVILWVVAC